MRNHLKHIQFISWLMFVVFIVPQTIQIHHVLTVHHHKTQYTAKHKKHFHVASKHCPIHDYVFTVTHKIELPIQISKHETQFYKKIILNVVDAELITPHRYYLRGPPSGK